MQRLNGQWEEVEKNWPVIEQFIRARLNRPYTTSITLLNCPEIEADPEIIEAALKHYAILHAEDENVAFVEYKYYWEKPYEYQGESRLTGKLVR